MRYLMFDLSEDADGHYSLDALATTRIDDQEATQAVMAEAQAVLDWAWREFAHSHGPVAEGADWDHDLQAQDEPGGWRTVSLTLAASEAFRQAFEEAFGPALSHRD